MTPLASCRITTVDDACIASIEGEVDSSNVPMLEAQILEAVPNDALGLVVDLTAVRYLDSAGIRLLFGLHERLSRRRQRCQLAVPDDAMIRRVLSVVHVEAVIPMAATVDTALAQIRQAI